MREKQNRSGKRNDKRKLKCRQCENYCYEDDYCLEKDIENCSMQNNINFSKCDDFLVRKNLVMF